MIKTTASSLLKRAKTTTPVDSGQLRQSSGLAIDSDGMSAVVYYLKEYAPHVEYGHRTTSGGYVKGRYYLKKAVDEEAPAFRARLKEVL